jgi:FkbM family methyltransferase
MHVVFRRVARRVGRRLPLIRRLIALRDAAIEAQREVLRRVLGVASPETYLHVKLNGAQLWLPRDTMKTMFHCAHWEADGTLSLWVETPHLAWMMDRLADGATFLDVGAATGATVLPIADRFARKVTIIAYEPAVAARALLIATLDRNRIEGVTIRPVGVSDTPGEFEFREYAQDETGSTPWQPEASSLAAPVMSAASHRAYTVPVVTLDNDALPHCSRPLVVKIDVEGFEAHVLRGAEQLIRTYRPHLSIDIHADPFGDGAVNTEAAVRVLLPNYAF